MEEKSIIENGNGKNNEKKRKYNYIQFTVEGSEKQQIEAYKEKSGIKTVSEFVRQAIKEKIRRMEHPEFYTSNINQMNPLILQQITQNTEKLINLQKLTLERDKIMNNMNKTLDLIRNFSVKTDLKEETQKIINLLKGHKSLQAKDIIEKTGIDKEIVFEIISNNKLFKITQKGRFALR